MPLALLILGALFITAAVRGDKCGGRQCADVLFQTMKDDFTGPGNFIYWGLALFLIGALGYYKPMKPLSNAFLTLVILVLFIANRGFFAKFLEQIGSTQHPSNNGQTVNADLSGLAGGGLFNLLTANANAAGQNNQSQDSNIWDQYKSTFSNSGLTMVANIFKF